VKNKLEDEKSTVESNLKECYMSNNISDIKRETIFFLLKSVRSIFDSADTTDKNRLMKLLIHSAKMY